MSLWHHDSQHGLWACLTQILFSDTNFEPGLIQWGVIIHRFIDGYSRLITGLRASNNNCSETVLDLFLSAAAVYGVPSCIRGDHGVKNILLAAWMECHHGKQHGAYIWGRYVLFLLKSFFFEYIIFRSVWNVCIECLWVDVTAQVSAYWSKFFVQLELWHSLNINNIHHIWLLQYLFLHIINTQLSFWVHSWNQHKLKIWDRPNRSPTDLFIFDMLVHGVWGDQLPDKEELSTEKLEVYGVDWENLQDDKLLRAWRQNNPMDEEGSSWVGFSAPQWGLCWITTW